MRHLVFSFLLISLFGCHIGAQNNSDPQRLSLHRIETIEDGLFPMNNTVNQSVHTYDFKDDKESIRNAAERTPYVTVQSVKFDRGTVVVTVTINHALTIPEQLDWKREISAAIAMVIPRYPIEIVIVQNGIE